MDTEQEQRICHIPFIWYNRLSIRLYNRFDNRLYRELEILINSFKTKPQILALTEVNYKNIDHLAYR